jgi:hypothetical protein
MRLSLAAAAVLIAATFTPAANAGIPPKLAAEARYVATHGGIICQTKGVGAECATPRMRELSRQLIAAQFAPAGSWAVQRAVCIASRESGLNPGARSTTGDHGLAQFNYEAHHHGWLDFGRVYDPVYATQAFWRMSGHGTSWGPWKGGAYRC